MTSALLVLLLCSPAAGPKIPVTGECARGFESLDGVITTHMTKIARRMDRYKEDTKALRKVINEFLEDR